MYPVTAALRTSAPFLIAIAASLLVVFDGTLAGLIPRRWWMMIGAEEWPIRVTPLVMIGLIAAAVAIRSSPGYLAILIAGLQLNGLRIGPLDTFDLILAAGLPVLVARALSHPERPVRTGAPVHAALLLLLIAFPHVIVQDSIVRFGIGWLGLLRAFAITIVVINLITTREQLNAAVRVFILVATLSAMVGLLQFVASYFAGIHVSLIDPPESAFKPTPIGMVMRSSGFCITAQHQSGFLTLALPFALWRATTTWRKADVAAVAVIGLGIVVTWNMGGILVAAATGAGFVFARWPAYSIHVLIGAVLAGTLLLYFELLDPVLREVFNAGVVKGVSQRGTLMDIGLEKLDANLLVGTGPQGFATYSGNFWNRPVHNAYIQTATELGLAGAVVFALMHIYMITALALTAIHGTAADRPMILSFALAQAALIILMLAEPMMDHANTWFFVALAQAALWVLSRRSGSTGETAGRTA